MSSDGVNIVKKKMNLKNIEFTKQVLSVGSELIAENEALLIPNPMINSSELSFYSEINTKTNINIYSLTGALIKKIEEKTIAGNNNIKLLKEGLKSGMYFIKIKNDFRNYKTIKLIVN